MQKHFYLPACPTWQANFSGKRNVDANSRISGVFDFPLEGDNEVQMQVAKYTHDDPPAEAEALAFRQY